MKFQVTLTDPGANVFVTAEFAGMTDSYMSLERHKDFHTVQEFYNGTLQSFGKNVLRDGGRDFLKNVKNVYGADAIITVEIDVDFKFTGTFELLYSGVVAVGLFIETLENDHLLQLTISNSLFWQKFLKRLDEKVNLQSNGDVEGNPVTPMNFKAITLTTQKINKSYIAYRSKNAVIPINEITNPVFLVGFDQEDLKEIEQQSTLGAAVVTGGNSATYPEPGTVVPFWNLTDDGVLVIDNILLTMSFGGSTGDPNYTPSADFVNAKNNKCFALVNFDLYIQKNNDTPVAFTKTHRQVPTSFVRNDGVTDNLQTGLSSSHQVTDFTLPANFSLTIKKYDAVKIYMLDSSIVAPPVRDADGMIFLWGQNGWDHNSGFDQVRDGYQCFMKKQAGSAAHQPANSGNSGAIAYGGVFNATNGAFPDHIDDDAGLNQNISIGAFWTIGDDEGGVLPGGAIVTGDNVLTALANMVAGSAACQNPANWNIGVKTPYEGLENYAVGSTSFQGYYDPASGNFPTTEKDGVTAIKAIDNWFITSLKTNLQGAYVDSTYIIQALKDVPGNVRANWWIGTRQQYDDYYLQDQQFQGGYDASVNLYPATRFDTTAIQADDIWLITTGGTFGGVGGVPVNAGDVIRANVNAPGRVNGNWSVYTLEQWQTYAKANLKVFNGIKVTFETTYPDTVAQGFLLHDVAAAITDRITGQADLLTSDLLGNAYTKKVYGATGGFSLLALFKGLQIRGYDLVQKPFFISMREFFHQGINNIACLALGKYKIGGNDAIVIKTRAEAYDPTIIVKLNFVQTIKSQYNEEEQHNSAEFGYSTWQSKNGQSGSGISSGLDDFQTLQTRNTLFKNIGKKITLKSDLIAASLNIESTRRVTNKQSANYQFDNNSFIIALNSTVTRPELSENFSETDNVLNDSTRYNKRLSTLRSFMRHLDWLSGCLQPYLASFWRFASGEGNYNAATKATSNFLGDNTGVLLTENQDIAPSANPLYLDEIYEIEHFLDWTCYKLLRDNPDKAIGISQSDTDHVPFFIENLQWRFTNGTISLKAKPKSHFDIKTVTTPVSGSKKYEPAYEGAYE